MTQTEGLNMEKLVPTALFFKCNKMTIQVSIFYKRGDYYWIGDDIKKQSNPLWFGDVPRAMNKHLSFFYLNFLKK